MNEILRQSFSDQLQLDIQLIARDIGNAMLVLERMSSMEIAPEIFHDFAELISGVKMEAAELYAGVIEASAFNDGKS